MTKSSILKLLTLLAFLSGNCLAADASQNRSLTEACSKLAVFMAKAQKKKLAVMDITGVDGRPTELGKTIAEDLIVEFFAAEKMNFVVVDRSNLNRLLEEQKRASEGFLKLDDARRLKELGRLTGADAFLFGTIAEVGEQFQITLKIVATDTAEIVGAARMSIPRSDDVRVLNQNDAGAATADSRRGKAASDKRFTAKKAVWKEGAIEGQLANFVVNKEGDITATVRIRNLSKEETLHLCSNGTTSTSKALTRLKDSSGLRFVLADQDGLVAYCGTPTGYQTLLNELHFNQTSTLDQLPVIAPGQDTVVTVRFKEEDASKGGSRDNCYGMTMELIYFFAKGRARSGPRTGTLFFEDVRPF